jgi:hypothetical protein
MVEEKDFFGVRSGLHFDATPFALDLYRLLCMYLADRKVMNLVLESDVIGELRGTHLYGEVLRILISSAITLRIASDQYPHIFKRLRRMNKDTCGVLWPDWPKRKNEPLTIREACNKIIHAKAIQRDIANPDPFGNPQNPEAYVAPYVYLYGNKDEKDWRVELSIVDFVRRGAGVYLAIIGH